ncbi:MAG: putative mRNA 3-end processing factor [Bradymonadia bacterium]|jgi:putative mRNA 3-end processing factor
MELLRATRSGLHCDAGQFVIDPTRKAKVAVVTHAHSDHARPGSELYHCSREGERVMRARVGKDANIVGHEWGAPFELGGVRVSLHPAGHIRGSAQVRVEHGGEVWVASGDYKRESDPTCTPFEVVPCDVFITEATFALPIYRWEPTEVVVREIWEWWQANKLAGKTSLLFCYSLGKAQRVLAGLTQFTNETAYLHGAALPLTALYRDDGVAMLPTESATVEGSGEKFEGALVIAPPSASRTTWMRRFKKSETAFASGWMRVRGIRRGRGWDRGFVLSDHVDWPGIIETVDACGASRVLATHGRTDVLVRYLRERGLDADALETAYGSGEDA